MKKNQKHNSRALSGISRSINLQLLIGLGIMMVPRNSEKIPEFMNELSFLGFVLILLGINTGLYLKLYRKEIDNQKIVRTS